MKKKKTWLDKGIDNLSKDGKLEGKTILKDALPKKMSAVLLDFARPLLDEIDITNKLAMNSALRIAVIIWNYAVMKGRPMKKSKDEEINGLLDLTITQISGDPIGRKTVRACLES